MQKAAPDSKAKPVRRRQHVRRTIDVSTSDPQTPITERMAAEEVLGIATITLTQKRARGEAPPHFKIGRNVRYVLRDVLAWRDARTVGRTA